MSEAFSIEFKGEQVAKLFAQMRRAEKELGKDLKQSVQWGGILLAKSLVAATKVSAKLRPIIKRPRWDKNYSRAKNDSRFAPFGVKRWDKDGKKYFKPIYRTGEFGKIRFFDKKTASWYDRSGGSGKWRKLQSGYDVANPEILVPGIKSDKRRIIGRRALAKKTWQWAARYMSSSGSTSIMNVPDIASIQWGGERDNPSVTITNRIRYMDKAMKGGMGAVNSAMGKAARSMAWKINQALEKKLK
jgi:hypothetical protein